MSILNRFSFKNYDWGITIIVLVLSAISLSAIYSIDLSRKSELTLFPTQMVALFLGLIIYFFASSLHVSFYRSTAKIFYITALFLLVAVLFLGQNIRGTTGWFRLGFFSFQPAEFAKLSLAVFLAWLINRYGRNSGRYQFVLVTGFFTFLFAFLILLQPDLGSTLILCAVWFGMLFFSGTKKKYIFFLIFSFLLLAISAWFFVFKDYQKDRLLTFLDPGRDPLGSGYNVTQSIIAIGSGRFFGKGLGFGSQSQLHFLPEAQTDFIFSAIAEELGFLGALVVLSLFAYLFWRILRISKNSKDDFCAFLSLAIFLVLFVQMIVNLGGATGLLPVTGVTLPFLSYGGSSLLINWFLVGIIQSVYRYGSAQHT